MEKLGTKNKLLFKFKGRVKPELQNSDGTFTITLDGKERIIGDRQFFFVGNDIIEMLKSVDMNQLRSFQVGPYEETWE